MRFRSFFATMAVLLVSTSACPFADSSWSGVLVTKGKVRVYSGPSGRSRKVAAQRDGVVSFTRSESEPDAFQLSFLGDAQYLHGYLAGTETIQELLQYQGPNPPEFLQESTSWVERAAFLGPDEHLNPPPFLGMVGTFRLSRNLDKLKVKLTIPLSGSTDALEGLTGKLTVKGVLYPE